MFDFSFLNGWVFSNCNIYSNDKISPGDLVFFADRNFPLMDGKITSKEIQSVAMIVKAEEDGIAMVREIPRQGVVRTEHKDICDAETMFARITVLRFDLDETIRLKAAELVLNEVGASYNDILSTRYVNSHGERAFYASQLTQYAYNTAAHMQIIPSERVDFGSGTQMITPKWIDYFARLNYPVPVGIMGVNPSQLFDNDHLSCIADSYS